MKNKMCAYTTLLVLLCVVREIKKKCNFISNLILFRGEEGFRRHRRSSPKLFISVGNSRAPTSNI